MESFDSAVSVLDEKTVVEKVARALRDADAIWASRKWPEIDAGAIAEMISEAADECGYEDLARAAIKAYSEAIRGSGE